jgi:hypothetical protein
MGLDAAIQDEGIRFKAEHTSAVLITTGSAGEGGIPEVPMGLPTPAVSAMGPPISPIGIALT